MHLVVGDAGNVEGVARTFIDAGVPKPTSCICASSPLSCGAVG